VIGLALVSVNISVQWDKRGIAGRSERRPGAAEQDLGTMTPAIAAIADVPLLVTAWCSSSAPRPASSPVHCDLPGLGQSV